MRTYLVLVFFVGILSLSYTQESLKLEHVNLDSDSTTFDWYQAPSLRWNATALANTFIPAASLVFEYPLNKILGIEVEGGALVPYSQASFEGEKFSGFRFRIGPKVYLAYNEDDLFYLRAAFRYDRADFLSFKRVLDPSGAFTEDQLVEGTFEIFGWLVYAGFMTDLGKNNRFVFDTSFGFGWSRWNEQLSINAASTVLDERALFERNRQDGRAPVISFNIQLGYRF